MEDTTQVAATASDSIDAILFLIVFIPLSIAFLYYGYRDDYRRDKKGFLDTIIGVPLSFAGIDFAALKKMLGFKTEEKK